jgi:NAD(P)-dependent dehydrogenase (short-subunit alcohol dehydrogenase family)
MFLFVKVITLAAALAAGCYAEDAKVVLITGARSGIGMSSAIAYAADGWTVYAGVRDINHCTPLVDEAKKAGVKGRIHVLQMDVTSDEQVKAAVSTVRRPHPQWSRTVHAEPPQLALNSRLTRVRSASLLPRAVFRITASLVVLNLLAACGEMSRADLGDLATHCATHALVQFQLLTLRLPMAGACQRGPHRCCNAQRRADLIPHLGRLRPRSRPRYFRSQLLGTIPRTSSGAAVDARAKDGSHPVRVHNRSPRPLPISRGVHGTEGGVCDRSLFHATDSGSRRRDGDRRGTWPRCRHGSLHDRLREKQRNCSRSRGFSERDILQRNVSYFRFYWNLCSVCGHACTAVRAGSACASSAS